MPPDKIVILGGTGFVGRAVCERLVDLTGGAGTRLCVPTRRIAHAREVQFLPTVDPVEADVHDDADLARVLAGSSAVINLVGTLHGSEAAFERAHAALPRRLAAACAAQGIRRIVHISALGADAAAPSRYLRSKARGEAALQDSGLDVTLLRPSVMFGVGDHFLNLFAELQRAFPLMPLGGANAQFQPVWVGDVAAAVGICMDRRDTIGRTYELAGPDVMSLKDLVRAAGHWSGHARPIVPLPGFIASLQALALECLPGEPLMSRDNLASMRVPSVASGRLPGLTDLGIVPTPVAAVAPSYLAPAHSDEAGRLDHWRAARSVR